MEGTPVNRLLVEKNDVVIHTVATMSVKDKRKIFSLLRKSQPVEGLNFIFPKFGAITIGEFCTAHVLQTDNKRKKKTNMAAI
jgi:hypothetical protein